MRLLAVFCFFSTVVLHSQTWVWAKRTQSLDFVQTVQTDNGNVWILGYFKDQCVIDDLDFVSQGKNILLTMLSEDGKLIWFKTITAGTIFPVALIPQENQVILTCNFAGKMTGLVSDSTSAMNYFMAKINQHGSVLAYKKEGGSDHAALISADGKGGEIVCLAVHNGSTDISGIPVHIKHDNFYSVTRYNQAWNPLFIKSIFSKDAYSGLGLVRVDNTGNVFIHGKLCDSVKFIGDTSYFLNQYTYEYENYTYRLNSSGKLKAIARVSGYAASLGNFQAYGDNDRLIQLIGFSCNHCTGGVNINKLNVAGMSTSYNPNQIAWQHIYGGESVYSENPRGINSAAMNSSDLKICYAFSLYSGEFLINNDTVISPSMFVAILDHSGNYIFSTNVKSGVRATNISNIQKTGVIISGTGSTETFFGNHGLDLTGESYGYVAKLGWPDVTGLETTIKPHPISIFPNPAESSVSVVFPESQPALIIVRDLNGFEVFRSNYSSSPAILNTKELKSGIYIMQLNSGGLKSFVKLVKK